MSRTGTYRNIQMRTMIGGGTIAVVVAGLALSVPGPAEAAGRTPWHVTIHPDRTTVTVGQKVWLTGRVAKAASGRLVRLYERSSTGQPWHYQRNALVHRDGSYTTYDKPTTNRQRQYRVVMPKSKHHRKGASRTVVIDVYKWTSLTTLAAVNDQDLSPEPSVAMNGVSYPSSLEAAIFHYPGAPTSQSVEFNVNHGCTAFRGTFGLSDDSVAGSQATVTAGADGTPWFGQSFGVGQSTADTVTWDTAPLKLRFTSVSTVDGADGLGAVGTPEVYCELR
jgi:hypothetical protein